MVIMALLLLANTIGAITTGVTNSGTISTGYEAEDALSGPRSRLVRAEAATSHHINYACPSTAVTHCVLSGADLFKNSEDPSQILVQYGGGPTTDSTTAAGSMSLVGPESQDWVQTIAQTSTNFRLRFEHNTSKATMYGKVYFANSFDFGTAPQLIQMVEEEEIVKPLRGYQDYATEKRFRFRWENITRGKMESFRGRGSTEGIPYFWPLFLYDENQDIFDHQLEHVIISDPFTEVRNIGGLYDIEVEFRRLKHYKR
jgi:hypothetical protein